MPAPVVDDLRKLDVETRLKIVQELWDSIVDDTDGPARLPLSDGDRAVLDERLADDNARPDDVVPCVDVKRQLQRGR